MQPSTQYQWSRMIARFADYRVAHPEGPITASVCAFLRSLTPANGATAWLGLRAALPHLDWRSIPHPRPRRDEATLLATLFAPDELVIIRATPMSPRDRALMEIFWTLRRVESTRPDWADVNLTDGTVRIVRKGGKSTWTLLRPEAQLALAEWFVAAGQPPDATPIFPGRVGGRLHAHSVGCIVRRVLKRAGVYRRWRGAHAFRRTLATRWLAQHPGDLSGLAKLLGHEQLATTHLYNWAQPAELRPRLDRVRL